MGTLVPRNIATPLKAALGQIEKKHGDIDDYVAGELGYSQKDLHKYFAGEQIDAIALAIDNIANGNGFIIGDQTGIGKGRVNAAIIRYANKKGMTPVFVTMKPDLYADMIRDLHDIGETNFRPLPTNSGLSSEKAIPLPNGKELRTGESKKHMALMRNAADTGFKDHDAVFTTYDQLSSTGSEPRRELLMQIAPNALFILDESHNAGADSGARNKKDAKVGRATFIRGMLARSQNGVFYSSATYAKRPDVMSLYFKTDMRHAVEDIGKLADAISAGGIPLQQVVAAQLTESGQYIRRERSFEGASVDIAPAKVDMQNAEQSATIMRAIRDFNAIKETAIKEAEKKAKAKGESVTDNKATGDKGASSVNFTSVMHNLIGQSLLAIKSVAAADEAAAAVERGEKPVITLANTMGSFIKEEVDRDAVVPGGRLKTTFKDLYKRYLEKTRTLTRKDRGGKTIESRLLTDEEIGPAGVAAYNAALRVIDKSAFANLPISPIDAITQELERRGISVGEITGRNDAVEYREDEPHYRTRKTSPAKNIDTVRKFNNGQLDAIILNQSGSTGISLHSSSTFTDQRKRTMIIVQPELNIDVFMQTLGRVFRTGQVVPPSYKLLTSDMPAEKRPAAVLGKKMAGLNANTTASRKSDTSFQNIPDFLNEYGDAVAAQIMEEETELHAALGSPLKGADGASLSREDAVKKVTGRIPMLPIKEQQALYERIEKEYSELIEQIESTGGSTLEARTLPLDAKLVSEETLTPAKDVGSTSPFASESKLGLFDVKVLGKPYTPEQVQEMVKKGNETTPHPIDIERSATEWMDEKTSGIDDAEAKQRFRVKMTDNKTIVKYIFTGFPVGKTVIVSTNDSTFYGIVTRSEFNGKEGSNPVAPSSWRMTVAVADPAKQITLPFSKISTDPSADIKFGGAFVSDSRISIKDIMNMFLSGQTSRREQRYIAHGNILAAFASVNGKGQIVNFEDSDGAIRPGILFKKDTSKGEIIGNAGVSFPDFSYMAGFFDATNGKGIIKTADGNLTLLRLADGSMKINSEASKAKGAQFFLNGKLLNAAGKDFVKSGNSMTMTVPATTAERMVGVLREQGYGFIADNHIEEARTVMGLDKKDNAPRASITPGQFLPPPAPVTRSPGGTKENAVLRVVEDMQAKAANAAPMEIVQDFEDLPAYLKSYFEGDAKSVDNLEGLYDPLSGKVFLIASNLESPQRAAEVWLHEQVVHHGLRSLLPDGDRQRLLNNLWASSGGMNNAEIADIARHYGLDPRGNPEDRHIVMEEYLASLAEKNKAGLLTSPQEKSLWRRFVEAISRAWRSMLQAAGVSDGLMASKEMDALLTELGEHVMGGLPQTGGARGMREASASRGTSPPQRPPAPLASWTSSPMGKLTGAEKAMRMVENEDIGSFFPDKTDLTTMKRIVMLPHWIAKKFPQFGTIYRRQLRRMDERNADKMQSLQEVPSLFGDKGELVRGKDMDDLRTLIWNNDGQAIPDLVNTPKFVPDGKFENGRAILKKNSAWDREYEKWLAKQPGSDAAKKAMLEVRQSLDNDLMRAHNRMAEMSEMSDGDIANFRQTINHQHNYFPHHRYGKYYVQAKVGDEVVFRKHFDATGRELAKKKAAEIIAEQRKNFPGAAWRADENSKLPEEVYGAPLDTEAMEQVIKAATSKLEDKGQAESVRSALSEAIADTLKARGWGSHAIGRKGIPGHEDQDILRVLHDYKAGLSGWLTKMEAAKDFAKALGKIDARNHPVEWGYASQYVKDMLRNTEKIDRVAGNIKSVAFAWYLGANLKTAALNLTQNIISGVPRLHMDITGGAGYFQAAMDAIVHNVTGKSDGMNADEKKLLQELYDNAVITEGYMEEVRGRVSGVDGAALWNRLLKSMGWFMAVAERFNRASLALAAYRAARGGNLKKNVRTEYGITGEKADHEQAKAYAENIVRDAHFVYGKANTPEALRSSAAGRAVSPAYTFRTFSHNLLSLWSWALRTQGVEGAKMVSKGLGATLLIGGVASAPFFGTAMALFQAATGSDDDWMEELRKLATKYLGAGDMGRDIISYGIPSVVGVNLGGSLKMETPFSHSMKKGGTLKEVLTDSIGDIIGIPYDMFVQRPSKVADAYRNLNAYRMAEEAMPTAVQNAMRAWRLHTDGQTSMSGRSINDPGSKGARKLTGTEALGKLLGFQPVSSTKSYDRYSANKHSDNVRSDKAGEFAARTLKLREEGKSVSAVREDMKAWNDEMKKAEKPWMVIKQEDVDRRVVARRRDGKLSDRERPRAAAQAVVW